MAGRGAKAGSNDGPREGLAASNDWSRGLYRLKGLFYRFAPSLITR